MTILAEQARGPSEPVAAFQFARRYDDLMAQPWVAPFYAGSGFFNTGYWAPDVQTQPEACERLIDELTRRLPAAPSRLLDVGCGLGATTRALQSRLPNTNILGINISRRQLVSHRHASTDPGFAVMDASRPAVRDGSLDAVVSVEAAFHFNTRQEFFRQAFRGLKPGGTLVLSDILYRDVSAIGDWMVPDANRITDLDAYSRQLRDAGFERVEISDVTQPCWDGFCESMRRFFETAHAAGSVDEITFRGMMQLLDRLGGCVAYYLIASARKRDQ